MGWIGWQRRRWGRGVVRTHLQEMIPHFVSPPNPISDYMLDLTIQEQVATHLVRYLDVQEKVNIQKVISDLLVQAVLGMVLLVQTAQAMPQQPHLGSFVMKA